jgi:YHS domain-containing protein
MVCGAVADPAAPVQTRVGCKNRPRRASNAVGAPRAPPKERTMIDRRLALLSLVAGAAALTLNLSARAQAGAFFEKEGVALRAHDPVAYFKDNRPVKGSPEFKAQWQGSVFHFASAANRDAFQADPAKYAPQYGGYCAFGVAGGYKATTDPAAFTIEGGKLYLNYNAAVQTQWRADIPGFVVKADRHWPSVMSHTKVHE